MHRIREVVLFGEPFATLGIYVGSHPDFDPAPGAARERLAILGREVDWLVESNDEGHVEQALVPLDGAGVLHLFATTPDDARSTTVRAVARSLSLERSR